MAPPASAATDRRGEPSLILEAGVGLATGKQPYEHPLFPDTTHAGVKFYPDTSERISLESNTPVFKLGLTMPIRIIKGHFLELGIDGGYGFSEYFQQESFSFHMGYMHRLASRVALDWAAAYLMQATQFEDRETRNGGLILGNDYIQHGGGITAGLVAYVNPHFAIKIYVGMKLFQANQLPNQIDDWLDLGFTGGLTLLWDVFGNKDMTE